MKLSRIRALRGPNLWSRHTAIEAIVSCSETECLIDKIPHLIDRLRGQFPHMDLSQPVRHHGAATMAHVLERATLALQVQAGCPVTFSKTIQTLETGIFQVVVEYSEEAVGRLAIELSQTPSILAMP